MIWNCANAEVLCRQILWGRVRRRADFWGRIAAQFKHKQSAVNQVENQNRSGSTEEANILEAEEFITSQIKLTFAICAISLFPGGDALISSHINQTRHCFCHKLSLSYGTPVSADRRWLGKRPIAESSVEADYMALSEALSELPLILNSLIEPSISIRITLLVTQ